jgi:hypothetical protein
MCTCTHTKYSVTKVLKIEVVVRVLIFCLIVLIKVNKSIVLGLLAKIKCKIKFK